MSIPKHQFCDENKEYLLNFLKVAKEQKSNKYCDLNKHEVLSNIIPLDEQLSNDLKDYVIKQDTVVAISEDDEVQDEDSISNNFEIAQLNLILDEDLESSTQKINHSTLEDITFSIKENLDTHKHLSTSVLNDLQESKINHEEIFSSLSEELNSVEVLNFGVTLKSVILHNDAVVSNYVRYLLIKQLTLEYSTQLQEIFSEFSMKYPDILLKELTNCFLSTESKSKVFLQFVNGLDVNFKAKIFRNFIFSCQCLHENYIDVIETLLSSQVEYDSLNKLTEVLSTASSRFNTNKAFGKLILKTINYLGKNAVHLEQPLKHIMGSHKSIWQAKIQRAFEDCSQDGSLLSQTLNFSKVV